jgi:hypothetical protein
MSKLVAIQGCALWSAVVEWYCRGWFPDAQLKSTSSSNQNIGRCDSNVRNVELLALPVLL